MKKQCKLTALSFALLGFPLQICSCSSHPSTVVVTTQQLYIIDEGFVFGKEAYKSGRFIFEYGLTVTSEVIDLLEAKSNYDLNASYAGGGYHHFTEFYFDRYEIGGDYLKPGYVLNEDITLYFGII